MYVNKDKRQFDLNYGRIALSIGMVVIVTLISTIFFFANRTVDSYELTGSYESGKDVRGYQVEIVVQEKGHNPMVGEFLWDERMDISYVTFDRINVDNVGVGDTVVIEVYDIVETMGVYVVEIYDVEVIGR